MSPTDLLDRQKEHQKMDRDFEMFDLTTATGIQKFFNGATSFENECTRYRLIIAANGGLRPAVLDAHPIRTKFFATSYPGPGIGYVCGE